MENLPQPTDGAARARDAAGKAVGVSGKTIDYATQHAQVCAPSQAVPFSVGANATHGKQRTNADKRKAVLTLLADAEWNGWSDREIARRTLTSHGFVASLRPPVTGNVTSENEPTRTYTTKHGTKATNLSAAVMGQASECRAGPSGSDDTRAPASASVCRTHPPG